MPLSGSQQCLLPITARFLPTLSAAIGIQPSELPVFSLTVGKKVQPRNLILRLRFLRRAASDTSGVLNSFLGLKFPHAFNRSCPFTAHGFLNREC